MRYVTLALALLGCAAAPHAAEHTLKLVSLANTQDEDYAGAVAFRDYVEAESGGAIEVEIFPGGQLCGNSIECLLALKAGVMDIYMSTLSGLANFFPEIQVLDLPYLFDGDETVEALFAGPFVDELGFGILDRTGLRLMTIGNTGGWRNLANTRREVRSPADLRGLKIRTIDSPIQIRLTRALGASPTPVPWPELYTSLATGVVDGSKNGLTDILSARLHEHLKFVTMDRHAYMSALWLMNNDAYNTLSPEHQAVVSQGFDILRQVTMDFPKDKQAASVAEFEASGGVIYEPTAEEMAAFRKAAEPLREWYVTQYGDTWLNALEEAIAALP
jgi:TRAP-type transport system periplasmic protein